MARIRSIKPEFWDSPSTAKAGPWARLLYLAMWNWADDWGIGDASASRLRAFAFPNDEVSAADYPRLVAEVHSAYGVVFFEHLGRRYFTIPTFGTHQRTEKKAKPREDLIAAAENACNDGRYQPNLPLASESPTLDADSPSPEVGSRNRGSRNRGTGEVVPRERGDSDFDEFWAAYPRKVAKGQARKAWTAAAKTTPARTIVVAAINFADWSAKEDPNFIPYPATWLNGERWNDERPPPPRQNGTKLDGHVALVNQIAAEEAANNMPQIGAS